MRRATTATAGSCSTCSAACATPEHHTTLLTTLLTTEGTDLALHAASVDPAGLSVGGVDVVWWALVVVAVAVYLGALVQGLVGLGLGLLGAPVTTLVAPQLMPDALLWLVLALPLSTLVRDHDDIDWRGLAWVVPARVPGVALGVAAVAVFSERALGITVALMVLAASALTWWSVRVPLRRSTLVGAGIASGFSGTTTSVGGPPVAILYQRRPPTQIRSTLAVFFAVSGVMSLTGLALAGQVRPGSLAVAGLLVVPAVLGGATARGLRDRVPEQRVRPAVLAVCAASALVLLVVSLV